MSKCSEFCKNQSKQKIVGPHIFIHLLYVNVNICVTLIINLIEMSNLEVLGLSMVINSNLSREVLYTITAKIHTVAGGPIQSVNKIILSFKTELLIRPKAAPQYQNNGSCFTIDQSLVTQIHKKNSQRLLILIKHICIHVHPV